MFILSDTHGDKKLFNGFLKSSEKICLQLGDFGFIWKYNDWKYNKFLNNFEKNYPDKQIFTVLGNHENYSSIKKMPIKTINGARCRIIKKNIFAVERGEVLTIEGKNILCIGGADSTDSHLREIGTEWWVDEAITNIDITKALTNIKLYDTIDIVASHTQPDSFLEEKYKIFDYSTSKSREKLNFILEKLFCFKQQITWFSGHLHENLEYKEKNITFKILGIGDYQLI